MNDFIDEATGGRFEAGLTVSGEIVGTVDKMLSIGPDTVLSWQGKTEMSPEQFKTLKQKLFKDVVYLKETNPGHFTIVDGHGTIGQAISDKVNLIPVWFEKRNNTIEKFNLNLTTYQLEPINGDSSS